MTPDENEALRLAPKLDLVGRSIMRCNGNDPVVIPFIAGRDHYDYSLGPCWSKVYRLDNGIKTWLKPHIRCICGKWSGIGLHHVHADGRVTASFFDATAEQLRQMGKTGQFTPGCGWHVYLKLADYDMGEFPPDK